MKPSKGSEPYAQVLYDIKLKRPGCALLQALAGGFTTNGENTSQFFDNATWLLAPTKEMKLYPVSSKEELDGLVTLTEKYNKKLIDRRG